MVDKKKNTGFKIFCYILGFLIWVGVSIIAAQFIVGYLMAWFVGGEALSTPLYTAIYSALSYVLALGLIVFIPWCFAKKDKKEKKETVKAERKKLLGLQSWPTWTDIGLAPVGFIVYLMLAAGLTALFTLFPWFDAGQQQNLGFNYLGSGIDRIIAFITLVVIAPIAEEVIFRGWLYGKLRSKLSEKLTNKVGMAIAITLVSLLFGLVHLQWNVGVNVFAMSIVLCALREITGTIHAGILLHMLKNGVAFYLLYVVGL